MKERNLTMPERPPHPLPRWGEQALRPRRQFIHRLISPKHQVAKVYAVTLKHAVEPELVEALRAGVLLRDESEPTAALDCVVVDAQRIHLTLGEGKYHQVKRMVAAIGNRVEALRRMAIGGLQLPEDLAEGRWRWLSAADQLALTAADSCPA